MSSLEPPAERAADAHEDEGAESASESAGRTVHLDGDDARLSIPESATPAEAAAVAAAVGAHLTDRRRAAAVAAAADDLATDANRWKVAARLPGSRAATLPRDVERGALWRAASRSL